MIARASTDSLASKPDPLKDRNEVNMWSVTCSTTNTRNIFDSDVFQTQTCRTKRRKIIPFCLKVNCNKGTREIAAIENSETKGL